MLDICVKRANARPSQMPVRNGESCESWQKIKMRKANDVGDLRAHVADRCCWPADRLKGGAQQLPPHMSGVYRPQTSGSSYIGNFVDSDIFGVTQPASAYNSQPWTIAPTSHQQYCPGQMSFQQYYGQAHQYSQPHLSLPGYGLPWQAEAQQFFPQQYTRVEPNKGVALTAKGIIPEWALSAENIAEPKQQLKKSNRQYSGFAPESVNFQESPQTAAKTENTSKDIASAPHSLNRNESDTNLERDLQQFAQRNQQVPLYRKVSRTKEQLKEQVRELQQRLLEKELSGRRFKYKEHARRLIDLNSYSPSIIKNKSWSPSPRNSPSIGTPKSPAARSSILRPQASSSFSRHRPYTYPTRTPYANHLEKSRVWSDYSPVRWTPMVNGAAHMGFRAYVPKQSTSKFVVNEATSPITSAIFSDLLQQKGRRRSSSSRSRASPYQDEPNPQEKSQSKKKNSKSAQSLRTSKSKHKLKKAQSKLKPTQTKSRAAADNVQLGNFTNSYDHLWYAKRLPPPLHAYAPAVPPQNKRQVCYVDRQNFLPANSSAKNRKFN